MSRKQGFRSSFLVHPPTRGRLLSLCVCVSACQTSRLPFSCIQVTLPLAFDPTLTPPHPLTLPHTIFMVTRGFLVGPQSGRDLDSSHVLSPADVSRRILVAEVVV